MGKHTEGEKVTPKNPPRVNQLLDHRNQLTGAQFSFALIMMYH